MELSLVKGIGPARAAQLGRLGIGTVEELLAHFPRDYQDKSKLVAIADAEIDEVNIIKAVVRDARLSRVNGKFLVKAKLLDDSGALEGVWFNMPYMKNAFKSVPYIFTGVVTQSRSRGLQMLSPDYEPYSENMPKIVPMYQCAGISQKLLRGFIHSALELLTDDDALDEGIQEKYGLCPRGYAVRNIHFPENDEAFFRARERLVFEELFTMQMRLLRMKSGARQKADFIPAADFTPVLEMLPYSPTPAQTRVLDEIMADMSSGYRMNRLVQGDVGSGKTLIAMLTAYAVIMSGAQAALMAPTEVLAAQHYKSFEIFEKIGLRTAYLSGSQTRVERERALEELATGEAHMIIGTHALIQPGVNFCGLGLVITDEQHRFGVRQRGELSGKAAPHVLVMSATPIPRSLALILYGDMDVSIVDSLPPGRQKVETYAVTPAYRERLYGFIKERLDEGRQAYMLCAAIESEGMESVTALTESVTQKFAGYSVGMLHGRMKAEQRRDIMHGFAEGRFDILVSTTVIEVGVNVPNATVMVIENAERFGLAQLHQLRGRVGRGAHKSYCVLITDSKSKLCKQRLNAMKKSNDGFYISELDLRLRGGGDFFGTRQHGLPELGIANLYKDMDILKKAQQAAAEVESLGSEGDWVVI